MQTFKSNHIARFSSRDQPGLNRPKELKLYEFKIGTVQDLHPTYIPNLKLLLSREIFMRKIMNYKVVTDQDHSNKTDLEEDQIMIIVDLEDQVDAHLWLQKIKNFR